MKKRKDNLFYYILKILKMTTFLVLLASLQAFAAETTAEQAEGQVVLSADQALADATMKLQPRTVTGVVTDEEGQPYPGVYVLIQGTTRGAMTDVQGRYTIQVEGPDDVLVFSFVGTETQEITVGNQTEINVTLVTEAAELQDIVVVGYGTQLKANVVGSVTAVGGEKIASIPASDVTNAISGRLPGSVVIQETGEPGQNEAEITVRGRTTLGGGTDPLVVVDGIPGRSLFELDPQDIESISVLKDAAAAIYGASAANGVILVTTKSGRVGKPRLNYQFYQGWMTPTRIVDVTNAGDYATMLSEYQDYENRPRTYTDRDIELFYSGEDPWEHPNSDWLDDLVADWTTSARHSVSIDGGSENLYYYVSFGYRNEEAIYEQESTKYEQYNLRAKIDLPITDWLKVGVDYAGFRNSRLYPTKSAGSIYGQASRLVPVQWSFWPTGEPGPDIEYGDNPVVTSTFETGYDDQKEYRNQMTFRGEIAPPVIEGLTLGINYTYDIDNDYRKRFVKPWILYFPQWSTAVRDPSTGFITSMDLTPTPRGVSAPQLTEYYSRSIKKLGLVSVNYNRNFGDHALAVYGSYEWLDQHWNNFDAYRTYYISDVVQTLSAGADADKTNSGGMGLYARKSLIGRLNYSFQGKYLMEFIIRRDGSLKFPEDGRWGNFPAIMLGWRASEENFWKENLSFINYFKLRATYGQMGMDPGSAFQYLNKYQLSTGQAMGSGKVVEVVVRPAGVANPNITWEKQTTYNLGFDSQILNRLFHLDVELFYNKREDILTARNASVPDFTGLDLPDENIAEVDNRGFEFDAGFHKRITSDLQVDIGGNMSWNRNKVVFMDEPERSVPWHRQTGHPYGATLLYNSLGIFSTQAEVDGYPHWSGAGPGDVKFEDYDGDGDVDADDRTFLDKTDAPEIFYGITIDATWKNFTLSVLGQGQGEYWRVRFADSRRGEAGNYFQYNFDGRWQQEGDVTDVARAYNRGDQYWNWDVNRSTYDMANMAYLRLKNVVLSYDIPPNIFGPLGVSRAQIYFSGYNLALLYSAQDYFDPEIGAPMTYPAVKTFAVGAKVTF